jgi:hypothetical protein
MTTMLEFFRKICNREPDVTIGSKANPYLHRWHVIPRNPIFNIYLHHFLRSDDDRALHDHPWINMSLLLDGEYIEVTPKGRFWRRKGHFYFRMPKALHRVELLQIYHQVGPNCGDTITEEKPVWTLFITGPRVREWGFACPKGWVSHKIFGSTDKDGSHVVGKGCD